MSYCMSLRFAHRPDYSHIRRMFRVVGETEGFVDDGVFDWTALEAAGEVCEESRVLCARVGCNVQQAGESQ
jgi:hypothetical protein